jgi:hypothetical protein
VSVMTWNNFLDAYPRSHLVVAWLHGRHRTNKVRRARFDHLKRAAVALEPYGAWAITNANPGEIYIAYEKAADAAQLCTLVRPSPSTLVFNGSRKRRFSSKGKPEGRSRIC